MAITSIGTLGTAATSGAGTSFQLTTATNALSNSGDIGFLLVVSDNVATADGNSNSHTSVTGGTGTWTKIYEQANTVGGAAADGMCVSLWRFQSTGTNAIGTVFTINHASTGDRCAAMWKFTVGAGSNLVLAAAPNGYVTDGANGFGTNTIRVEQRVAPLPRRLRQGSELHHRANPVNELYRTHRHTFAQ
jgi:hypothetical protein